MLKKHQKELALAGLLLVICIFLNFQNSRFLSPENM